MTDRMPVALSVMAHPDDAEIFCAGTLILLQEAGFEVHIATMTPGDCGSREHDASAIAGIRRAEAAEAAARIRAEYHCLDGRDLQIVYGPESVKTVTEIVRATRPDIVFTHPPVDYMADHEETSRIARAACFAASAPNFDTGRRPAAAATDKIPHLYYASPAGGHDLFGRPAECSVFVDVSSVIGLKADMLACHRSQREWLRAQHGMDHYIEEMRSWAAEQGRRAGYEYAEGFRQHVGHPYPAVDLVAERLADFTSEAQSKGGR